MGPWGCAMITVPQMAWALERTHSVLTRSESRTLNIVSSGPGFGFRLVMGMPDPLIRLSSPPSGSCQLGLDGKSSAFRQFH